MMKSKSVIIALCSLAVLVSVPVSAQDAPAVNQVVTVKVKPGANAGVEEYVAAVREVSQQLDLENYWLASQSVSGPAIYTFVLNRDGWSGLADPGPQPRFAEVLGEREAERLTNLFTNAVESVSTAFYVTRPALSVPPNDLEGTPDAVIYYNLTIHEGMMPQYVQTAIATREAAQAVAPDLRYIVQTPSFCATGVRLVAIINSWSDLSSNLGPGQMTVQHYGDTLGAALSAAAQETIANIEISLNRTRPDLGYQPD